MLLVLLEIIYFSLFSVLKTHTNKWDTRFYIDIEEEKEKGMYHEEKHEKHEIKRIQ
jgi:prephenate dehydratase